MSHEGNDWLAEKELEEYEEKHMTPHIETDEEYARRVASINMEGIEEEPQTTLAEDLENLVSEFSRGKISEERVVEALEGIVKYYKEHM